MRKFLIYALLPVALLSCQKESIISKHDGAQLSDDSLLLLQKKRIPRGETTDYAAYFNNLCYPEVVFLSGTTTTLPVQYFTRRGKLYRVEVIKYDKVSGIGITSGLIYKGGGELRSVEEILPDNSAVITSSYEAIYRTSQGNALIFDNRTRYTISPTGDVTPVYNKVNDRCR